MRRGRRRGPARGSQPPPPGDLRARHALRHRRPARGRLLLRGHVLPPRDLLPRPLLPSPLRPPPHAPRLRLPGLQRHQPLREVLPLHRQPGDPRGLRPRGPRPHHRPRHNAGPPVAGALPHPGLPARRPAAGAADRARLVHGGARGHGEEAVGLRGDAGAAVRVPGSGGQGREPRPGAARRVAEGGGGRALAPPLAVRRHRLRHQHALASAEVGAEGGDNGGAGPEPGGLVPGPVRGGHPLLLGPLRLPGRELRRGQPGAAHRRAAAPLPGDPQRARRRRPRPLRRGPLRQLAGEAPAVGLPGGLPRRQRRRAGHPPPRHVPLGRLHPRRGERHPQARVEGPLPTHRLRLAPRRRRHRRLRRRHRRRHCRRYRSCRLLSVAGELGSFSFQRYSLGC